MPLYPGYLHAFGAGTHRGLGDHWIMHAAKKKKLSTCYHNMIQGNVKICCSK